MYNVKEVRPTHLEVHIDRIIHNVKATKERVGESKLIATVKGDMYGLGIRETLKYIEDSGADMYAVATLEEAIELRRIGTKKEVMVLGYTSPTQYGRALEFDITLTVFDLEDTKYLNKLASEQEGIAKVHIKVDTGMTRIGFDTSDGSVDDVESISKLNNVSIKGIFSHFTSADDIDKTTTHKQAELFFDFVERLEEKNIDLGLKHLSNTGATIDLPEYILDAVRVGYAFTGLYDDTVQIENMPLKPTVQLVSELSRVHTVESGTGIGYGGAYITHKDKTDIATIPIGYADGLKRQLSQKGSVLINGKRAPIRGNLCMDQMMVESTGIDCKAGDRVVLFGFEENAPTIKELAKLIGTNYIDIISGHIRRVPIVYYLNGEVVAITDYLEDTKYVVGK